MCYKTPLPLLLVDAPPRRLCPVCGVVSYSREGIHPQCAERRADAPRMERVMADMKVAERVVGQFENRSGTGCLGRN
jgi:hypothetical protein